MAQTNGTDVRPRVTLPQGTVVGVRETGAYPNPVEAFKAIPYALPPTGDRRFRPPVPVGPAPATTVIDASQFGYRAPSAAQLVSFGPALDQSEDCLTANVFRPVPTSAPGGEPKLLPVMLYFHGGAFNRGYAAMHDTASMVGWSAAPFVAVSFGYRVGALGFLPSALSAREGVLNLGLKDQICMMEWVRENIARFGGDPDNVTLMGLSAGAHSIGHHLLDYEEGKTPLFKRVIMESGAPTSRAVRAPDAPIHEQQFRDFLHEAGCPPDFDDSAIFPFLRSLPSATVTHAQDVVFKRYNPSLRWAFQPVIDGEIIRRRPIDGWREGKWHRVPILTGFQENEGSMYVDKAMATPAQFLGFWRTLLPQLTDADVADIDKLYPDPSTARDSPYSEDARDLPSPGVGAMYRRIEAAYAHYAYVAPVRQTALFAAPAAPVFLYHWALVKDAVMGAAHGDNFLYGVRDAATCARSPALEALAAFYHGYVTSFICAGDPNAVAGIGGHGTRPTWVPYDREEPKVMIFGAKNKELVGGKVSGEPCEMADDVWAKEESDFWWSKVEISQQ